MSSDPSAPEMSSTTRGILAKAQQMIPPMLDKFHKGQLGRVAVIGGSKDYTGAPYFSAMASAKLGCDMSHVVCTPEAGAVIKTYSPNLMVHPLMRQTPPSSDSAPRAEDVAKEIIDMLPRLHVLVVGPGLGRDPLMQDTISHVVRAARKAGLPIVLDADALQVVQKDPSLVRGYASAVMTPNVVEFKRLWSALGKEGEGSVEVLSKELGGVTIIQKGGQDLVSNGSKTLTVDLQGGKKRSGGQGDTLTGAIATFLGWRKAYMDGLWDVGEKMGEEETIALAAFAGSAITRECSRLAFEKKGRSLQASDLTEEVHNAFTNLFGDVDGDAGAKL